MMQCGLSRHIRMKFPTLKIAMAWNTEMPIRPVIAPLMLQIPSYCMRKYHFFPTCKDHIFFSKCEESKTLKTHSPPLAESVLMKMGGRDISLQYTFRSNWLSVSSMNSTAVGVYWDFERCCLKSSKKTMAFTPLG